MQRLWIPIDTKTVCKMSVNLIEKLSIQKANNSYWILQRMFNNSKKCQQICLMSYRLQTINWVTSAEVNTVCYTNRISNLYTRWIIILKNFELHNILPADYVNTIKDLSFCKHTKILITPSGCLKVILYFLLHTLTIK